MRIFTLTALATVMLGLGTALAIAQPAAATGTSPGPLVTRPDPTSSRYVSVERALQRLELEARLEDFYAEQRGKAQGLGFAERESLYREAERELRLLVLGSETYSGAAAGQGMAYLNDARLVLRRELGLAG